MSEERLERIEGKVDILVSGQIDLGMRVDRVEERLGVVEVRLGTVEGRLDNVEEGLASVKEGLANLSEGHQTLQASVMQIAEGHMALTVQIARGFENLELMIDRRLIPLEDTVRKHSAKLGM